MNRKDAGGYPWLYKLPVVGYLFGVKSGAREVVERIFVITPRIVEVNSKNLGDYSEYFKPSPTVENAIETGKMSDVLPPFSPLPTATNTPVTLISSDSTKNSSSKNRSKKKQHPKTTVSSSPPVQQHKNDTNKDFALPAALSLDD